MNDAVNTLDSLSDKGHSALGDGRRTLAVILFSLLFHLALVLLLSSLWHNWQQRLENRRQNETVTVELKQARTVPPKAKPASPKIPVIPRIHHPRTAPQPRTKPQTQPKPQPKQAQTPKPKPKPQARSEPQPKPRMPPLPVDNANSVDLHGNMIHGPDTHKPIKGEKHPKKIVLPGQQRQVLHPQPQKQAQAGKQAKHQAVPAQHSGKAAGQGQHSQAARRGHPEASPSDNRHLQHQPQSHSVTSTRGEAAPRASESRQSREKTPAKKQGNKGSLGSLLSASPESGGGGPPIPDKALQHLKGMQALSDKSMKQVVIGEPFSEIEARRIRMMNLYLRRMKKQILDHWHVPDKSSPSESGVIDIKLDPHGYLESASIDLPSGNALLDESALDAVRSVIRFKVPGSTEVAAEYYHVLRFSYRGGVQGKKDD